MNHRVVFILLFSLSTLQVCAQQKRVEKSKAISEELDLSPAQVRAMKDTIAAYEEAERIRKKQLVKRLSSMLSAQQRMRMLRLIQARRGMWRR